MQVEHQLLDRPLGDELADKDGFVMADAVGEVGRLILDGRVPSGIVLNDGVGSGEIVFPAHAA